MEDNLTLDARQRGRWIRDIWKRFKRNKLACISLFILILLILAAVFAGFVAPYGYDEQNPSIAMQSPSLKHWFGTDNFGRDILSRIIYGSRISLRVGIISVGIALLLGGTLGAISAYYTRFDNLIMRSMDLFMAIPQMLLAITIASSLGPGLINLMIAVGLSSTPRYARVVRAAVLSQKEQEFVEAAVSIGASNTRILLYHIIPNALSPIIVQATLGVASAIITGSAMSFLGFGIQAPIPEWGAMLSGGRAYIRTHSYMSVFPGLAIMLLVYSLNELGDGLRDALDPRLK